MLAGKIHDLRHLGFSNFVRIDTANSDAFVVNVQHDASRIILSLIEEPLEHKNNELHRRKIIIQKKNFIKTWLLRLRTRFGNDAGFTLVVAIIATRPAIRAVLARKPNRTLRVHRNVDRHLNLKLLRRGARHQAKSHGSGYWHHRPPRNTSPSIQNVS